jgi:hypothetical protein
MMDLAIHISCSFLFCGSTMLKLIFQVMTHHINKFRYLDIVTMYSPVSILIGAPNKNSKKVKTRTLESIQLKLIILFQEYSMVQIMLPNCTFAIQFWQHKNFMMAAYWVLIPLLIHHAQARMPMWLNLTMTSLFEQLHLQVKSRCALPIYQELLMILQQKLNRVQGQL